MDHTVTLYNDKKQEVKKIEIKNSWLELSQLNADMEMRINKNISSYKIFANTKNGPKKIYISTNPPAKPDIIAYLWKGEKYIYSISKNAKKVLADKGIDLYIYRSKENPFDHYAFSPQVENALVEAGIKIKRENFK